MPDNSALAVTALERAPHAHACYIRPNLRANLRRLDLSLAQTRQQAHSLLPVSPHAFGLCGHACTTELLLVHAYRVADCHSTRSDHMCTSAQQGHRLWGRSGTRAQTKRRKSARLHTRLSALAHHTHRWVSFRNPPYANSGTPHSRAGSAPQRAGHRAREGHPTPRHPPYSPRPAPSATRKGTFQNFFFPKGSFPCP
jgi:hypothetical protein